jgi:hypothetical protein
VAHRVVLLAAVAAFLPATAAAAAAPTLVSGDGESSAVAISDDGGLALYNTEEGDQRVDRAYLRDTRTGALEPVTAAAGDVIASDLSRDGRFVAYSSAAENGAVVHDRATGRRELVGPGGSDGKVSDDGTVATFSTVAALVPADTDTWLDVYVATRGTVALATPATPRAHIDHHALSPDGRWLTYTEAPTGSAESTFTAVTRRYDVRSGRTRTIARHRYHPKSYAFHTAVSDSGRRIAFTRWYEDRRAHPAEGFEIALWTGGRRRRVRAISRPGCDGARHAHGTSLEMTPGGGRVAWAGPRPEDFVDGFEPEEPWAAFLTGPRCRVTELKLNEDESELREGVDQIALSRNGKWALLGTSRDNIYAGGL